MKILFAFNVLIRKYFDNVSFNFFYFFVFFFALFILFCFHFFAFNVLNRKYYDNFSCINFI